MGKDHQGADATGEGIERIEVEIDVPETPISMKVMSSEHNVLVFWVTGVKHPDITYEDYDRCSYHGPGSTDGRLEGAVNAINNVLIQWEQGTRDKEAADISSANSGLSGLVSKLLSQWKEVTPPPQLDDFFYLRELDYTGFDLKAGGIGTKVAPWNVPSGLREKFDISGLIDDLKQAVPDIQSAALEGLKAQDIGNARENYLFMASNALKKIGEDTPGVNLKMREAEINHSIGRDLPEGVTFEGE